jgi:threonyl-tRNA synthetase
MSEVTITLPDQSSRRVRTGTTAGDVLRAWKPEEFDHVLAASWEGVPIDLSRPMQAPGRLSPLTFQDRAGRDILEHSAAHLVAKAVVEVIPSAFPTDGPPTEDGFYYDFDVRPLTPDDLIEIERSMDRTVARGATYERVEVPKAEASAIFANNRYKLSYLAKIPDDEPVSIYRTDGFVDLCRGPHVPDTHWLQGVKVLGFSAITPRVGSGPSGLQRVRGIAFPTKSELEAYLKLRTEAAARDHRAYGQRLDLFLFEEESPGFPFWLPNGMIVVRELEKFVREHLEKSGYGEVRTPLLFAQSVYDTSGHWDHFRKEMFLSDVEGRTFGWKPMNCPGSMLIFRSRARSYRELPLRLAEFAPLHRLEPSGALHGLTRVRELVQDDAHIFVTEEQIEPELRSLLDWIKEAFETFRLSWSYEFSTRPAKFLGEPADWDRAEAILEKVLKESGAPYRVSPGEGGFYAPKIDIINRDSLGRPWQTGTIQLDYQMPKRFRLEYQGPDGQIHVPVVIHRTILGTWERFTGILLEHCAGKLPPWLAPIQVRLLPVAERNESLAETMLQELRQQGIRAELVRAEDTLSKRVRKAEVDRIPYIGVLGDAEETTGQVAVRVRGEKAQQKLPRSEFVQRVRSTIRDRTFGP